jgi:hypothetical protein
MSKECILSILKSLRERNHLWVDYDPTGRILLLTPLMKLVPFLILSSCGSGLCLCLHPAVFQAGQPRLKSMEFLYSMFDARRSLVSFIDQTGRRAASGAADT